MKKTISLILALCICATLCVTLASCGGHKWREDWDYDDDSHWHRCDEFGGCEEISDKAEHTMGDWTNNGSKCESKCTVCEYTISNSHVWNDGEITTAATAEANGVKTFTCTRCGAIKTEDVKYTPKKTVTESTWNSVLSLAGVTSYTVTHTYSEGTASSTKKLTVTYDDGVIYIAERDWYFFKEGTTYYQYYQSSGDEWVKVSDAGTENRYKLWNDCLSFDQYFDMDDFEFDEEDKIYQMKSSSHISVSQKTETGSTISMTFNDAWVNWSDDQLKSIVLYGYPEDSDVSVTISISYENSDLTLPTSAS